MVFNLITNGISKVSAKLTVTSYVVITLTPSGGVGGLSNLVIVRRKSLS